VTLEKIPLTMRAVVITKPGGPEVLRIEQRPTPRPGSGEILVRVQGSAMNRADVLQRIGRYPPPAGAPPDIPGLEIAGTVAALGPDASRWPVGARVFGLVPGGGHADYVVASEDTLCAIPDRLDWTAASATPEAFMTANDALDQADVPSGGSVLIHAVASGVGLAAVQLARARGLMPLGSSRSATKLAVAAELGMADGFDASGGIDAMAEWVRARTGGKGADAALDLLGGPYVRATLDALARRGICVMIGTIAGNEATIPLSMILQKRLTVRGTVLRSRALDERVRNATTFTAAVLPLLSAGTVRPVIDRGFPLEEIADAHRLVEANSTVGKVVIRMTSDP
jgi:putative PIG3 family NAD(P)H quinone oxidoreductase